MELAPMGERAYAAFASCLSTSRIETLASWLTATEARSWRRHGAVFRALTSPTANDQWADSLDSEISVAFRCLISAYVRMMAARTLPPFLICYAVHDHDQAGLALLEATLQDLAGGPTIVLLTSEKPFLPTALRDLSHGKVEIRTPTASEWRELARRLDGPEVSLRGFEEGPPVFHHLVAERGFKREQLQNRLPPTTRLLSGMDDEYTEVVYSVSLVDGALSMGLLADFMAELGVARVRTPEVVNDLQRLGYLRRTVLLTTGIAGIKDSIARAFPATARRVRTALSHYLHTRRGDIDLSKPFYAFLLETSESTEALSTIRFYLERLLFSRRFREARSILYGSIPTFPGSAETQARSLLHLILYLNRLRLALLMQDEATADRVFPGWRNLTIYSPKSALHGDYLLTKAQYLGAKNSRDEGLALVKKAILAYQDVDDGRGVAVANGEFGLVLLGQGTVTGARDYFAISSRTSAQLAESRDSLHAGVLELCTEVILGNLTRAAERAEALRDDASRLACREYELFLDFVRARVAFELGDYDGAEDRFADGLSSATVFDNEPALALFRRWLGRTVSYRGAPSRGIEILMGTPMTAESRLFRTEALILLGQFGDAAAEAAGEEESRFRPGCAPAWDSGFANIEDRSMKSGDGIISHLSWALTAYARAEHGDVAGGIEQLHALTRAGSSALRDPYAAQYLFLYSCILPENGGEDLEDMVTILGKAVKHLQERTSRIDNYGDKTSYLRRNYWNAKLIEKAKRFNLV